VTADPKTISSFATSEEGQPLDVPGDPFTASASETAPNRLHPGWHVWLLRIRALLFVTVCATFGVLLLIVPWTEKWTDSPLLLTRPELRHIVSSGFVRGLASGLGLLDLWLGFWEAIHYHETSGQ
jgi:hypothetical protein